MANEHWFVRRQARVANKKAKKKEKIAEELKTDNQDGSRESADSLEIVCYLLID